MEDQYGMADLRQYIGGRPNFFPPEAAAPPPDLLSSHRGLSQPLPYDMLLFRSDSTTGAAQSVATNVAGGAASSSGGGCFGGFDNGLNSGGDGGAGRWPRQETLTLLEIRSRLDPKFKEANQKGPLWDEVSRIMCEEHGYQRSGKKCREKFENLYKYYKKTKEGKAGRQDGKHYRFFRQLEALYGENNNSSSVSISEAHHHHHTNFHYNSFPNKDASLLIQRPKLSDNTSLSLSNYSEDNTTSSDDNDDEANKNKKMRWKLKIKEFIDLQMKKVMDKQEAWMEKMMTTIEQKEHERMLREEEWRKQDSARIEREHRFWASERAWIEARDAALMEALRKLTGKELMAVADIRGESKDEMWPENEITRLIQLKAATDGKFDGLSENIYWEEIANKMGCLGHERSAVVCKDKWESVNNYAIKCNSKKRKENTKICNNFYDQIFTAHQSDVSNQNGSGVYCGDGDGQGAHEPVMRLCDQNQSSPNNNNSSSSNNNNISESCFRYFMGDGYGRIMD